MCLAVIMSKPRKEFFGKLEMKALVSECAKPTMDLGGSSGTLGTVIMKKHRREGRGVLNQASIAAR